MALVLSLFLIWSAFHASVILLIFQPFSSPKMHVFWEFSSSSTAQYGKSRLAYVERWESSHTALTDLLFVLVWLECVADTTAELGNEWSTVGQSSFLCFWLFSWNLYAASKVLICAKSAWKHTKSGTWPFCPPCVGMKIKQKTHRDDNWLCGVLLLE